MRRGECDLRQRPDRNPRRLRRQRPERIIQGNLIGTDISGKKALGNSGDGIQFQYGATDETVGGLSPGMGNTIAYNYGDGVDVLRSASGDIDPLQRDLLQRMLGIDLGGDGVTPNHPGGRSRATRTALRTTRS